MDGVMLCSYGHTFVRTLHISTFTAIASIRIGFRSCVCLPPPLVRARNEVESSSEVLGRASEDESDGDDGDDDGDHDANNSEFTPISSSSPLFSYLVNFPLITSPVFVLSHTLWDPRPPMAPIGTSNLQGAHQNQQQHVRATPCHIHYHRQRTHGESNSVSQFICQTLFPSGGPMDMRGSG